MRSEENIEQHLVDGARAAGGLCWKLKPASAVGLPDRLILLPGARAGFLELKRAGEVPTGVQQYWLTRLRELGFHAGWSDSIESVDLFLRATK